jgi:hypothetical protein
MITQVGVSANTITNWANSLRGLVTWDIENLDLADAPIGGEGIIVKIDESKLYGSLEALRSLQRDVCLQSQCKIEVQTLLETSFNNMYSQELLYALIFGEDIEPCMTSEWNTRQ